jgi:hypothetical protein
MDVCSICAEELTPDAKACPLCGTQVPDHSSPPFPPPRTVKTGGSPAPSPGVAEMTTGRRECPDCRTTYEPDYPDGFCACGGELRPLAPNGPVPEMTSPVREEKAAPIPPIAGTACLVVYSAERKPLHYHPLDKDVTIIGRTDPVRGDFPDLDLTPFLAEVEARRISRKHAMVLRSRETQTYVLRPLAKNTGTQIETQIAPELQDHPLKDGTRIVLGGGCVRIKFEIAR